MQHLDRQLATFRQQLAVEVGLTENESMKVATLIAADVRFLSAEGKQAVVEASWVPIKQRIAQVKSFEQWSKFAESHTRVPEIGHARFIVQNYICFAYLKDACFKVLLGHLEPIGVAYRCAAFLCRGKLHDFRNAFAHSNWCKSESEAALNCWVAVDWRKPNGPHREFQVTAAELEFWQALARGVAYATYHQLDA